ncbi:pyruvate carboxylase [Hippea maritima]|uniref:Pyruvate carboxylase n=1 Tax=Hippea maritima (strain ATCC 700847 / DSM 10411 / MH2) TaxID=760142 RepID=F2LX53_HIPMA|nr:pyruvate carboxylase [Hippea maritima]AEA33111.1 pyruvate carboxylase [Hippea maritima DSM 10411]
MRIKKLLCANRGEIAIRVFRAATELGIKTVAVYSEEDKYSLHRYKADEAYLIGKGLDPVAAYLNIDEIIDLALRKGVDAIHPGYGFLSESAEFARRCQEAGIIFIGPKPEVVELFGDKLISKQVAKKCGVPVVEGSDKNIASIDEAKEFAKSIGYPVMLKATAGGGGRGIRIVFNDKDIEDNFDSLRREALNSFGRDDVIMEKYLPAPKHIEVQILADNHGNIVHLYERNCSIQRRHQKMIEIAPSPSVPGSVLEALYDASLKIAAETGITSAATIEFLVQDRDFYFLEVNPRIQVEHTITELITGIDLLQSQILIAEGKKLNDKEIGIYSQSSIKKLGYAIQCRITTEDPQNDFMPDTGEIQVYRSPAGFGVRLDAGSAYAGAKISPYYDSLLVKVSTWALTFEHAAKKMHRVLKEFRIRGVKTNIQFLENVITHKKFLNTDFDVNFVDNTKELYRFPKRRDRATKVLKFLANNIVNNPSNAVIDDKIVLPVVPIYKEKFGVKVPRGWKNVLDDEGVEGVLKKISESKRVLVTDTTLRDAHQSLLATRVRTKDMLNVADLYTYHLNNLFSLEMWGGATFDVAYRFLKESPWDRLRKLRKKIPNILFQMLLRASNAVGYTNYPDNVVREFISAASDNGIDVFRIFDCFNWVEQLKPAMDEVKKCGKICEAAISYTGDVLDKSKTKYTLDYYVNLAKQLKEAGADIIAIKDMAGLVKPYAAKVLVEAIKAETNLPVHFHTHDTSGNGEASVLMAIEAGADIVDLAMSSMASLTSQPSLNSILAVLEPTDKALNIDKDVAQEVANYFEKVRKYYFPFESGLKAPTAEVYEHEIPGGQYSNLIVQVESLGLIDKWEDIKKMYKKVNDMLGDLIKVTPSSKVVGDLALFMVQNNLEPEDLYRKGDNLSFPDSVVSFFKGMLGQPYGGFPEKLAKIVLKGEKPIKERPGKLLGDYDFDEAHKELKAKFKREFNKEELISYALYPKVFTDYVEFVNEYGDASIFDTRTFFYPLNTQDEIEVEIEEGKTLFVKYISMAEPDKKGFRKVLFELNGQTRSVNIKDNKIAAAIKSNVKGNLDDPKDICAMMPGKIVKINVEEGNRVKKDDVIVITEAMKMETKIKVATDGVVAKVYLSEGDTIEAGDLIVRLK